MRVRIAVVHHVGVCQAVDCRRAVTEGKHRRRRQEAKRRKRREQNCEPEAQAGRERGQHGFSVNPPMPIVGPQ